MNEILFDLLLAVLIFISVIITRYVIPLLKEWIENIKDERLRKAVKDAVQMAEQTITASHSGKEKLAKVKDMLKLMLIKKNITMSDEQLTTLIESAVYAMKKE
ncbi:MAG: phage holin [Lachnospiraceae bacterium]|nr:phage holin [Lachnospiraceae bacterium]